MSLYTDFCSMVESWASSLSPAIPVLYGDSNEQPPDAGIWLEVRWFPGETRTYGMTGPVQRRGIGQISACTQQRPGAVTTATTAADQLLSTFPKGTTFGAGRFDREPWKTSVLVEGSRVSVPVAFPWVA